MVRNTSTICSFCGNGCGMFLRTCDEETIGVLPHIDHPISQGRLCIRGWNRFQNLRSVNRITRPLIRDGDQRKEVGWEAAFHQIKEKTFQLLDLYGPRSIGIVGSPWLTNEDNFLISLFAAQTLKTTNLDGSFRFGGAAALTALEQIFSQPLGSVGSIPSLSKSSAILVLGKESVRDFSPVGSRIIQASSQGSTVILVDPSCNKAEHFYQSHLRYPLEHLLHAFQEREEVPPEFSHLLEQSGSAVVFSAEHIKQSSSLMSLIDAFSFANNQPPNIIALSSSPNLRGAWDMGIRPGSPESSLLEMLEPGSQIKGLFVFADDLLTHLPLSSMANKLRDLEFLVVAERFFNETVHWAHCVLPIPLLAESEGTMTNCEGRVQQLKPALPMRGESRSLVQILSDVAGRLGNPWPVFSYAQVRREISKLIPAYQQIASAAEPDSLSETLLPPSLLSGVSAPRIAKSHGAQGEYLLIIFNTLYAWNRNRMILESPVLRTEYPILRLSLRISVQDARELKIRMGERVTVRSKHGAAQVPVELDENLPPSTVLLPSHFASAVESLAGKGEFDPKTHSLSSPDLYVTLVKC